MVKLILTTNNTTWGNLVRLDNRMQKIENSGTILNERAYDIVCMKKIIKGLLLCVKKLN